MSQASEDQGIASPSPRRDITAGLILILSALGSLIAAAHHPVIKVREANETFAQIGQSAFADRLVHGALILFLVAQLFAFCRFARQQGIHRASVLLGLIFYVLGTVAMISAALVDGFFVPEIGASYLNLPSTADLGLALLRFCSIAIQLFTKSGVIAISVAILFWSISFARAGRRPLVAAFIGVAAALWQIYILGHGSTITAHTIIFIVAAQILWNVAVGYLLIRGQV
jgi:hypothetical protein